MLTIYPVVTVNVSVNQTTQFRDVFDVGAILGPTTTALFGTNGRYESYGSLAEMISTNSEYKGHYVATDPEYIAAQKYFGVTPAPAKLIVIKYDASAESGPAIALADAIDKGAEFYGLYFCPASGMEESARKAHLLSLADALNSSKNGVLFYGTIGTAPAITETNGILYEMNSRAHKRTLHIACTSDISDAAGIMGLAMGMTRTHPNSAYALCYKTASTVTANNFTQDEVEQIQRMNGNVYVTRTRGRASIERGTTASGMRYDEVLYLDSIKTDLQNACYSLIADSDIKLPQADVTTTLFKNVISRVLEQYYGRGIISTFQWRGLPIADVETGDVIEHGYHIYADTYDNQTEQQRSAHEAMPMTILLCFSGSVESIVLNLQVQR